MGHEITFQEVIGGGSSDVKPIEINVAAARVRMEYERGRRRLVAYQERRSIDRAPARRYAPWNKSREIALKIFFSWKNVTRDRAKSQAKAIRLFGIKSKANS